MTSTRADRTTAAKAEAESLGDRAQTLLDWTRLNSRVVTAAAVVVFLAAVGYWFYVRSRQIQAVNAERSLLSAKQSMGAGNLPLAQTDLQKVVNRYGSTPAGVEASLLLAQVAYDQGKPQEGIDALKKASGSSAAAGMEPTLRSMIGDGYLQMAKPTDAAKEYEAAAAVARLDNERLLYKAKAARAYFVAADTGKARRLWEELRDDPKAETVSGEARVRLGELTARVAAKK
jgi:predicted negative regulator of RcsB-dependent stress response